MMFARCGGTGVYANGDTWSGTSSFEQQSNAALREHKRDKLVGAGRDVFPCSIQRQVGRLGSFIRAVDARKIRQSSTSRLSVHPFGIPSFTRGKTSAEVYLEK